ncbi:hypothetical protein HZH66_014280 [Vespula vulgaris]|uniref:Uncharacterized protein n=1 Tax=Vespula vulgaris TaxID=7454 RepID=A0A834J365_VESVU|nr:hypothetical protein HZH66_014280 [Vespula vulgaris]
MTFGITLYSQTNLNLIFLSQIVAKRYGEKQILNWIQKNIQPTVKHGRGGIMVWEYIAATGIGELVIISKIIDKHLCLNILKENLQKSADKLGIGSKFYFQQDCDPKHMANIMRQWSLYNTPHMLVTPPQSPNKNPIEHVWWKLEKRVKKYNITSKEHLKEI